MAGGLTDEQVFVRDTARDYLRDNSDYERLRRTIESEAGWDRPLWDGFARELGFAGLGIAEEQGGSGLGAIEQALILEELGRVLAPIPYFESAVLSAAILTAAGHEAHLPGIASGETIAVPALRGAAGAPLPGGIGPALADDRLTGAAHFVPFGHVADLLIVAARHAPGGWDGLTLLAIPADTPGVTTTRQTSLDLTRPYATIGFDVVVTPGMILARDGAALRHGLAVGAGLLASELLGGAERSLEELVAYSLERKQFGRQIGSFQAMKHRMADMKLAVEGARSAAGWAAQTIAAGGAIETVASAAYAWCGEAYRACAADAVQLHGGIGFTWEHHAHLFFKRARAGAALLDPPAHHYDLVAAAIVADPPTTRAA